MRIFYLAAALCMCCSLATAQPIHDKLAKAVKHLLADEQMKHAMLGFYVVDDNTGKILYDVNSNVGLAPASTQKIFTSIAALDILGKSYTYKTQLGYDGELTNGTLNGNLILVGRGDPSFGSWRYAHTKMDSVLQQIVDAIKAAGIHTINGDIILDDSKFSHQPIPGGWIWDDIGNYYGAGTWGINWNENQYDLTFKPGDNEGDSTGIITTHPLQAGYTIHNFVKTGAPKSGDNSYIYVPPYGTNGFAEGTIPAGEKSFTISGSMPYPFITLKDALAAKFENAGIHVNNGAFVSGLNLLQANKIVPTIVHPLHIYTSPTLDSLVYWFLQKSINLYGEAFAKTLAYERKGLGNTDDGVDVIRTFWTEQGIERSAVKMLDGSGLSPQNRVTAKAETQALQYAHTQLWFNSFYNSLPVYNGIKMKSGTIGGAKAFAGYHTAANGHAYTFSIIINNYDGGADSIVHKMYDVLNVLK